MQQNCIYHLFLWCHSEKQQEYHWSDQYILIQKALCVTKLGIHVDILIKALDHIAVRIYVICSYKYIPVIFIPLDKSETDSIILLKVQFDLFFYNIGVLFFFSF